MSETIRHASDPIPAVTDADMNAFTDALLDRVEREDGGDGPATGRLGKLAEAVETCTGTDYDTAEWLAARVFTTLETMRVESGAYRVPGEGEPWDVAAWLENLARP